MQGWIPHRWPARPAWRKNRPHSKANISGWTMDRPLLSDMTHSVTIITTSSSIIIIIRGFYLQKHSTIKLEPKNSQWSSDLTRNIPWQWSGVKAVSALKESQMGFRWPILLTRVVPSSTEETIITTLRVEQIWLIIRIGLVGEVPNRKPTLWVLAKMGPDRVFLQARCSKISKQNREAILRISKENW